MNATFGQFFLNIAFVLYFILYLPQLYHNAKYQAFKSMSITMHLMLLQAYSCDLFYAIGHHMPWQYLTVSLFGLSCIFIQHSQWMMATRAYKTFTISGCLIVLWPFSFWFFSHDAIWQYQIQAWVARILFILHFLPQIIKYHQNKSPRNAINMSYLGLSISLSSCDLLSAWFLHWEMANLWGSFLSLGLKLYLSYLSLNSIPKLSFLKTRSAL